VAAVKPQAAAPTPASTGGARSESRVCYQNSCLNAFTKVHSFKQYEKPVDCSLPLCNLLGYKQYTY